MSDGIGAVMSRMQEIQQLFGAPAAVPVPTRGSTGAAAAGAPAATAFDDVLGAATTSGPAAPAGAPTAAGPTAPVPVPAADPAPDRTGAAAVQAASRYIGVPYVWGGTDPATGLDCSGLVQRAYADLGVHLPRTSREQATVGTPVADLASAQPGDLVAFGSPVDHIGIYAGNGRMVVAPHTGTKVQVQAITRTPTAIRRILDGPVPTAAAGSEDGGATPATRYDPLFAKAQAQYGIPATLLSAVARVESDYDPTAISSAGARGLMQIMPGTAKDLGVDPMVPAQAVDGAARLLKQNLATFGSTELALAAYNAGDGAVRRYGGIPPYKETQAYVKRVMAYAAGGSA